MINWDNKSDAQLHSPRIIGLTGGIATGKSTVSDYLATTYNLPVLDADIYARVAVEIGSPVLDAIAHRYADILLPSGALNRLKLGEIIFNNPDEGQWLEQQIHPDVRKRFVTAIKELSAQTVVLVVPLLFEAGMTDLVTEIWVVYCPYQQQLERLMQRNGLTLEQAQARINSQMPIQEKCDRADVILDNSSTPEALLKQVDKALNLFLL